MFNSIWIYPVYYVITYLAVVPAYGLEHHLNNVRNPFLSMLMAFTTFIIMMHPFTLFFEGAAFLLGVRSVPGHLRDKYLFNGFVKYGVSTLFCVLAWWFMFTYVIESTR